MHLETERLTLRSFKESDIDRLTEISTDPIVMELFPANLKTPEAARRLLDRILQEEISYGFALWAVIHKETDKLIGFCGLIHQDVEGFEFIELGYRFDKNYWNRGYCTEAARACVSFATETLKIDMIYSMILPDNLSSIRVAEKVGMKTERMITYHGLEHQLYELPLND